MSAEVKLSIPPKQYAEMIALIRLAADEITKEQFIIVMTAAGYPAMSFNEKNYDDQVHYIARSVLSVVIR
jgi:5,10-methylenetetrahydrofolate reductase